MMAIVKHSFYILDASNPAQSDFRCGASPNPQNIPDWVTQTPTYKHGVENGVIFEVNAAAAKRMQKAGGHEAQIKELSDAASYAEMEKRNAEKAKDDAERLLAEKDLQIKKLEALLAAQIKPIEDGDQIPPAVDETPEPAGEPAEGKKSKTAKSK